MTKKKSWSPADIEPLLKGKSRSKAGPHWGEDALAAIVPAILAAHKVIHGELPAITSLGQAIMVLDSFGLSTADAARALGRDVGYLKVVQSNWRRRHGLSLAQHADHRAATIMSGKMRRPAPVVEPLPLAADRGLGHIGSRESGEAPRLPGEFDIHGKLIPLPPAPKKVKQVKHAARAEREDMDFEKKSNVGLDDDPIVVALIRDVGRAMCSAAWARAHGGEVLSDEQLDALPDDMRSILIRDEAAHEAMEQAAAPYRRGT